MDVLHRAHSTVIGELPSAGLESSSPKEQGWQLSGRTSNLSLVLWYPNEAPGCSLQVLCVHNRLYCIAFVSSHLAISACILLSREEVREGDMKGF